MSRGKVVRSAGVIGLWTAVSRVLGFVRDLIIATAFGTGLGAEAFVVSFRIPNLLRDLVGEGAMNSAFVPVLTECHEKEPSSFRRLSSALFLIMGSILLALTVLGVIFTPVIVRVIAPGFASSTEPDKLPLTIHLTRMMFPYIFLIGLSALAMGILNSLKEFSSSALGPALLNLSIIVSGYCFEKTYGPMALVVGVLIGGVLQLLFQAEALARKGFRFERPDARHPAVRRIGKLLLPRALGSAIYQLNVFVDSILASFDTIVGAGGQSALYYSNRLFQLPLAIFGLSLAQAVLPTFSSEAVRGDFDSFKKTLRMTMRTVTFAVLPAAVGLAVLAEPIVRIIFERGKFNAYSTSITASALFYYAFGLLSVCFVKLLVNAFYALKDTRTPVRTLFVAVAINIVLSLCWMKTLKISGLALASTISATVNAVILYRLLRRRLGPLGGREILEGLFKASIAAAVMGLAVGLYRHFHLDRLPSGGGARAFLDLFGAIVGALVLYALILASCLRKRPSDFFRMFSPGHAEEG